MNPLTPDSIPSLSALSSASDDPGDVRRILFQTPESEASNVKALTDSRSEEDETHSLFGSDIISDASENGGGGFPGNGGGFNYISPLLMPTSSQNLAKQRADCTDNVTFQPTCHGALSISPKDIAGGMFSILGMNKNAGDSSQEALSPSSIAADFGAELSMTTEFGAEPDAVTEVTSNVDHSVISWDRRIDSLERECATLKDIIKSDSVRILQLRTELSVARDKGPGGDPSNQKVVEVLQRENATLHSREFQHLKTIAVLKDHIEELENAQSSSPVMTKEIEQLRLQNELLANQAREPPRNNGFGLPFICSFVAVLPAESSVLRVRCKSLTFSIFPIFQIIENEAELNTIATENAELKERLAKQTTVATPQNNGSEASSRDQLQTQVLSLFAKIEEIENERARRDKAIEDDSRQTHKELATLKTMILEPESPPRLEDREIDFMPEECSSVDQGDCDDVEVTLEGQIITINSMLEEKENHPSAKPSNRAAKADDDCGAFCGCFPSLSVSEDE